MATTLLAFTRLVLADLWTFLKRQAVMGTLILGAITGFCACCFYFHRFGHIVELIIAWGSGIVLALLIVMMVVAAVVSACRYVHDRWVKASRAAAKSP